MPDCVLPVDNCSTFMSISSIRLVRRLPSSRGYRTRLYWLCILLIVCKHYYRMRFLGLIPISRYKISSRYLLVLHFRILRSTILLNN